MELVVDGFYPYLSVSGTTAAVSQLECNFAPLARLDLRNTLIDDKSSGLRVLPSNLSMMLADAISSGSSLLTRSVIRSYRAAVKAFDMPMYSNGELAVSLESNTEVPLAPVKFRCPLLSLRLCRCATQYMRHCRRDKNHKALRSKNQKGPPLCIYFQYPS